MIDLAIYRNDIENMVKASVEGDSFSLEYVQNTIFNLITEHCKQSLIAVNYDDRNISIITYPSNNKYICVSLEVFPDVKDIGNNYLNRLLMHILIPFSTNDDYHNSFGVNYLFHIGVQNSVWDFKSIDSFYDLFSSIGNDIDKLYDKNGIVSENKKVENKKNISLNEYGSMWSALKESSLDDNIDHK